jgi:RpiB/LacA/LacB family sugar-phosphate isomerase
MLRQADHKVVDFGEKNKRVDYSDIASRVAFGVSCASVERAVLLGAIGSEMALAANKIEGIRAVACFDEMQARLSREHLNSNVLCLGCELTSTSVMVKIIETWLNTGRGSGRYARRLSKIEVLEEALHRSKV